MPDQKQSQTAKESATSKARKKKESGVRETKAKGSNRPSEGYSLDTLMAILD